MATGAVENWLNVDQLGAVYPFVGTEVVLTIAGFVFWIGWHIYQLKKESAEFAADIENIKQQGGPGKVLEDEGRREMEDTVGQ